MSLASTIAALQRQSVNAAQLFDDLVLLHRQLTVNASHEPVDQLVTMADQALNIHNTLALLHDTLTPSKPKPAGGRRDCPNQIPLWHDAPANPGPYDD